MDYSTPLLFSLLAGSATLAGLTLTLFANRFIKRYSFAIVSLAAGVLLGTAFLHIIPEAEELIGHSLYVWLLLGFGIFYLLESLVGCHCKGCAHDHTLGPIAGAGLLLHSLLDGVAIVVGFEVSTQLGIITAIAVIVHELPEGIFTLSILLHSGMRKTRAFWWSIMVALATPIGALITILAFPNLNTEILGILLAIAAGSFIYIAAADLIPETHKKRSLTTGVFVFLGLLLMFAINSITGHEHIN